MPRDSRDDHFPRVINLDFFKNPASGGIETEQKTVQKIQFAWRSTENGLSGHHPTKCIDSGSNRTNLIFSVSVRSIHISEAIMNWNKPKVKEICIGMEINDYFPAEL